MLEQFSGVGALLGPGIYGLYYRRELIYIGQSKMLLTRLYQHRNNYMRNRRGKTVAGQAGKAILFDDIRIYPCPYQDLDRVERLLIANYKPKYNVAGVPKSTEAFTLTIGGISISVNEAVAAKSRRAPTEGFTRRV